jgi:hypothetical protein
MRSHSPGSPSEGPRLKQALAQGPLCVASFIGDATRLEPSPGLPQPLVCWKRSLIRRVAACPNSSGRDEPRIITDLSARCPRNRRLPRPPAQCLPIGVAELVHAALPHVSASGTGAAGGRAASPASDAFRCATRSRRRSIACTLGGVLDVLAFLYASTRRSTTRPEGFNSSCSRHSTA